MSLWQTDSWTDMLVSTSQIEKQIMIGDMQVQKRSIGLGKHGLFVMGKSLYTKNEQEELTTLCKTEKCLFVQIETLNYGGNNNTDLISSFKKGAYKKFITPYTAVIDLEKPEEEIFAAMKQNGRRNIRTSEKKGVDIQIAEKTDENIMTYFNLSKETTTRGKFSGHSFNYYKTFLELLPQSKLILAKKDNEIIAGGIFTFDADITYYYYGASTSKPEYRNLRAAYGVQWAAIKHAKSLDSKLYDFLGISGEGEDYDASLAGVTDFKLKLTPDARKVSESYIYIENKLMYEGLLLVKKLKKKFN